MKGKIILCVIYIAVTIIIEAGIYGLYVGNNFICMVGYFNLFRLVTSKQFMLEILMGLEIWLR